MHERQTGSPVKDGDEGLNDHGPFVSLDGVLKIVDRTFLLESQKIRIRDGIRAIKTKDSPDICELEGLIATGVKAVLEGLLGITFSELPPHEQLRVLNEVKKYEDRIIPSILITKLSGIPTP